jgi:hypothetical protein
MSESNDDLRHKCGVDPGSQWAKDLTRHPRSGYGRYGVYGDAKWFAFSCQRPYKTRQCHLGSSIGR